MVCVWGEGNINKIAGGHFPNVERHKSQDKKDPQVLRVVPEARFPSAKVGGGISGHSDTEKS